MSHEIKWTLLTPDGKTIYGIKNAADKPAQAVVFLAHGLGCSMYDYNHKHAADMLSGLGYDVFRFNFYDGREGGRMLVECTLQTHADDLNLVINEFCKQYAKIFVAGHSYGGATVMLANPKNLTAASMWDASYDLKQAQDDFAAKYKKVPQELGGGYRIDWGISTWIGQKMYDHARTLDAEKCRALAESFSAPVQSIFAADGYYVNKPFSYHNYGRPENIKRNQRDVVAGTTHCFYEGNTCEDLIAKTHTFFKRFL